MRKYIKTMDCIIPIIFRYCDVDTLSVIDLHKLFPKEYALYERYVSKKVRSTNTEKYITYFAKACFSKIPVNVYVERPDIVTDIINLFPWMENYQISLLSYFWSAVKDNPESIDKLYSWYNLNPEVAHLTTDYSYKYFWDDLRAYLLMRKFTKKNNTLAQFESFELKRMEFLGKERKTLHQCFVWHILNAAFDASDYVKYAKPFQCYIDTEEFKESHENHKFTPEFNMLALPFCNLDQYGVVSSDTIWNDKFWLMFAFHVVTLCNILRPLIHKLKQYQKRMFNSEPSKLHVESIIDNIITQLSKERPEGHKGELSLYNVTMFVELGITEFRHRGDGSRTNTDAFRYLISIMSEAQKSLFIDVFPECLTQHTYLFLKGTSNNGVVNKFLRQVSEINSINVLETIEAANFWTDKRILTKRFK